MNRETIKRLNGDAARLLLVLLTCDGTETLEDLPSLISLAGLNATQNTHGKNRYARAFQQLEDLGCIAVQGGSISVLFADLLSDEGNDPVCELCQRKPAAFEIDFRNAQGQAQGLFACPACTDQFKREKEPHALVLPIEVVLPHLRQGITGQDEIERLQKELADLLKLVQDFSDAALIGAQMEDQTEHDGRDYEERMQSLQRRVEALLDLKQERESCLIHSSSPASPPDHSTGAGRRLDTHHGPSIR